MWLSYATLLTSIRSLSPIPFSCVKDQLGHSSINMTVDTYGHLVPGANRAAMDRLPTVDIYGHKLKEKSREAAARTDEVVFGQ